MVKREIHSEQKIFREINFLETFLVNTLLSRNFCPKSMRLDFCSFHTVPKVYPKQRPTLQYQIRVQHQIRVQADLFEIFNKNQIIIQETKL